MAIPRRSIPRDEVKGALLVAMAAPHAPSCTRAIALDGRTYRCGRAVRAHDRQHDGIHDAFRSGSRSVVVDEEPPVSIAHGHEGNCESCTLRVDVGERIHVYADDVVVHERCPGSRERAQA